MASTKEVSILLLLILYAAMRTPANAQACPHFCLDAQYMTCESSGEEKLKPACNCCVAPKNCTIYLADGTSKYCN
ncbi:hypothetical protein SLA2020_370260 [Shorea laevis]